MRAASQILSLAAGYSAAGRAEANGVRYTAHPHEIAPHARSMTNQYLFTSESVSEGHPDKIADQISDAVLDAILRDDPMGRVACESFVITGQVHIAGEIT